MWQALGRSTLRRLQAPEAAERVHVLVGVLVFAASLLATKVSKAQSTSGGPESQRAASVVRSAIVQVRVWNDKDHRYSFGTGFPVATGGHIVTVEHILVEGAKPEVRLAGGTYWYRTRVIRSDIGKDLSLLQIEDSTGLPLLRPLRLAEHACFMNSMPLYAYGFLPNERRMLQQPGVVVSADPNYLLWNGQVARGYSGGPVCMPHSDLVIGVVVGKHADTILGHSEVRPVRDVVAFLRSTSTPVEPVPIGGE